MSSAIDDLGNALAETISMFFSDFHNPANPGLQKPVTQKRSNRASDWGQFVDFDDEGNAAPIPRTPKKKRPRRATRQVVRRNSLEDPKSWKAVRRELWKSFSAFSLFQSNHEPTPAPPTRCMHCHKELPLDQASHHWCVATTPASWASDSEDSMSCGEFESADENRVETPNETTVVSPPAQPSIDPWEALTRDRLLLIDGTAPSQSFLPENAPTPRTSDPWSALERTQHLSGSPPSHPITPFPRPYTTTVPSPQPSPSSPKEISKARARSESLTLHSNPSPPLLPLKPRTHTISEPVTSSLLPQRDSLDDALFYCNM